VIPGLVLFLAALAMRAASRNRHVRARLLASAVAFLLHGLLAAALGYGGISADLGQQVVNIQPLFLVFGVINGLAALLINPWRVDRLPDRFPTIVQDAIVIGLFAVGATVILQEKIFATTAVGAVVIGFALQDTLGNLFAGIAIQIEKPFRVGHWVRIADIDGQVREVTWRAMKVRTKSGNFVVVPNSKLADDIIINYSEPLLDTRVEVVVGVSYDHAPNVVKRVITDALADDLPLQAVRPPEVLVDDFADFSIVYRVWVWVRDFETDDFVKERIRSRLFYAFRRNGIVIPFPIATEIHKEDLPPPPRDYASDERALAQVPVFQSLAPETRMQLARATTRALYAAGELVVRQGDAGASMFVVVNGEVIVTIDPGGQEVARSGPGGFFGEMSLLTGEPRKATVRTTTDSELLEITVDAFRQFVLQNPAAVEHIGAAVAARRTELEQRRSSGPALSGVDTQGSFIDRIRRFLGLGD
jgi:small-conductance mechanosensitive channel/CRP-like cAMP-binding protein